eukprot:Pgem_evm1s19520
MQTTIWDMNRNCDFFSYNQSQILNTDVKKAFDTLEWEFLFTVLEEMGFPEIFISLIKNLYENGSSVVSINGFFSSGFFKTRGVNQGDPLSPILYIIAGEVLRLKVKAETKVITASYADDANYITTNQRQTLAVLKIVIAFGEEVTGNMIHLGKTNIIYSSNTQIHKIEKHPEIKTINTFTEVFKCLGVYMGNEKLAQYENENILKIKIEKNLKKITASNNLTMIEKYTAISLMIDAT